MPIFADRILHGGPSGLGMLMGAAGIGALAGGLTLASRKGLRGLGRWVVFAAAGFGVSLVLFSLSRTFWLSAALLVPVGFCMMVQMASSNTLVQSMVPDALRGRVMAIYSMMFMGMAPFGALFAGLIAERVGAPVTVAIGGVACVAASIVFGTGLPRFRSEARAVVLALQASGGQPVDEAANTPGAQVPREAFSE
jgi:MFS family permease